MRDWVDIFCRELGFSKPEERVGAAHTWFVHSLIHKLCTSIWCTFFANQLFTYNCITLIIGILYKIYMHSICSNTAKSQTHSQHWRDLSLPFQVETWPVLHCHLHTSPLVTTPGDPSHQSLPQEMCDSPLTEDRVQWTRTRPYTGDNKCLHLCLHEYFKFVSATVQ